MLTKVFTAQNANANSAAVVMRGEHGTIWITGTWDGATVSLEATPDGGTNWIPVAGAIYTTSGVRIFVLPTPCAVRLVVSNKGNTTAIDAWVG